MPSKLKDMDRSLIMAAIHQKDTKPEVLVRKVTHALGFRFRLHRRGLPGSPDIVFGPRRKVIFVHGCFWHRHSCSTGTRAVRTHSAFWEAKFARNQARDARVVQELQQMGWESLVVWECETKDRAALAAKLQAFLNGPAAIKEEAA